MRKHSLKKISEGTTQLGVIGRPKSRGKLGSLTKKDKSAIIGSDLIDLKVSAKQERPESRESMISVPDASMSLN